MVVIKKSVTIHPIVDEVVRKLWAIMIQKGYDATYSTTLNMLALGGYLSVSLMKEGSKEWQEYFKIINGFLNGNIETKPAEFSKAMTKYERYIMPKIRESSNEGKCEKDKEVG